MKLYNLIDFNLSRDFQIPLRVGSDVKMYVFGLMLLCFNFCTNGSPGLVVMGGDSCSEGGGFESRHHILDGHFSLIFVVKIVMMII